MVNRYVHDKPVAPKKVESRDGVVEEGSGGGGGGGRRLRPDLSILRRRKRETMVKKATLGFRVFGCLFCLISLSVMAADKYQGWALDSFNRYKEFRYCIAVNVIGFFYSAVQGCDLAYHLATGKYVFRHQLRYYLDFAIDQASLKAGQIPLDMTYAIAISIGKQGSKRLYRASKSYDLRMLTYLLISASSSAATRIDDWQSNWGKDKFPEMATASVGMSFLAFVAFASSSLISGIGIIIAVHIQPAEWEGNVPVGVRFLFPQIGRPPTKQGPLVGYCRLWSRPQFDSRL
ncbi:hypothetical protein RJ639_032427 [Escallonia herrerae]|uniref:CASP-like protein n=1 Tax=Escallonia herrerae TaxID=1293975 RepID=A0AA88WUU9_9ASTE|nr:hypothetical protein RJ639_032427 [Escallonia herrerae]